MKSNCTAQRFEFQGPGRRQITAEFNGGRISSDGGLMLLREVEKRRNVIERLAQCFHDFRNPLLIEHSVEHLLRQRIFALAAGYEDLNDHDVLREDALLASIVGKSDPTGKLRLRERDRGKALAGKSTLNRLEGGTTIIDGVTPDRYRRISADQDAIDKLFVDLFLESFESEPECIVLDIDATDNPLHGHQEGRFFHGYYDCHCYLPLYIFSDQQFLLCRLRKSDVGPATGTVEELERILHNIREKWPKVKILVRGDSGFSGEPLMSWCESNDADFVLGLARNQRLEHKMETAFERLEEQCAESEEPGRTFEDFQYSTLNSWSRERRVVGKAEITWKGPNPRFVVTSLSSEASDAKMVYEEIYCARGEMENRLKEQQLDLFSRRTSAHLMRVNQIRLCFSAVAYLLLEELRRVALVGTSMERSRCETIRLRLIKIGARVRVTARRVWISLASHHPSESIFAHVHKILTRAGPAGSVI